VGFTAGEIAAMLKSGATKMAQTIAMRAAGRNE
jgi:hypothetical protein